MATTKAFRQEVRAAVIKHGATYERSYTDKFKGGERRVCFYNVHVPADNAAAFAADIKAIGGRLTGEFTVDASGRKITICNVRGVCKLL